MRKQSGQKRGAKVRQRQARKKRRHDKIERRLTRQAASMADIPGTVVSRVGNRLVRHSPAFLASMANAKRPPAPVGGVIMTADAEEIAAVQAEIDAARQEELSLGAKAHFAKDGDTYRVTFGEGAHSGWVRKQAKLWQASETGKTWFGEYATRAAAAESLR